MIVGGAQGGQGELVDEAGFQFGEREFRGETVGTGADCGDGDAGLVDPRGAVFVVVVIAEAIDLKIRGGGEGGGAHRTRERETEAAIGELHITHFGRDLAIPDDALQAIGARAPAAGRAEVEAAVGRENAARDAGEKFFTGGVGGRLIAAEEGETHALPLARDFLEGRTDDDLGVVAGEHLAGEGSEFSARRVPEDLAAGDAHRAVREDDGGGLITFPRLLGREGLGVEARLPFQTRDVPVKIALGHVQQSARGLVVTLVLIDEEVAVGAQADSVGLAETAREGREVSVGGNLNGPAAPRQTRVLAGRFEDGRRIESAAHFAGGDRKFVTARAVGNDAEKIPCGVAAEAEEKLVVVVRDTPLAAEGVEGVGAAVSIGVGGFEEFGTMGDINDLVGLDDEPEGLVEAAGKAAPSSGGRAHPDFTVPRRDHERARRRKPDAHDTPAQLGGARDVLNAVTGERAGGGERERCDEQ